MLDDKIEELTMFEEALEIERPWRIDHHSFNHERGQLDIWISLVDKRPLTCSVCNTPGQPFYDIDQDEQVWRHLDFWEYKTFLHAPHPRVACRECGKVKYALVPWSRHNSSFTLKFDKWVLALHAQMPMVPASRLIREHDTRLWRIVHYYVDKAIEQQDLSQVRHIAVDETSSRRGHQYVTVVVDRDIRGDLRQRWQRPYHHDPICGALDRPSRDA